MTALGGLGIRVTIHTAGSIALFATIDRTVPVKYRQSISEGVLEWNMAFERIGYKDAIKVEVAA